MARSEAVDAHGIGSLIRELNKVDRTFRARLHRQIRVLAREVQMVVREMAVKQGFEKPGKSGRGSGALIRDVRYSVTRGTALIRETAVRDGKFRYPAVFEYGHSKWGHRPFLEPARRASSEHVYHEINRILRGVVDEFK